MKQMAYASQVRSGLNFSTAIATVVAVVLLMSVISCKKADVATLTGQTSTQHAGSTARTLTGTDSATVVTNIKDFYSYAYERSQNEPASPGGLSSTLTV